MARAVPSQIFLRSAPALTYVSSSGPAAGYLGLATAKTGTTLLNRLQSYPKLTHQDREALGRVASKSLRDVSPRRDLVREGERPRFMYMMLDGWACRYKTLPDGRRQIIAFFVPGDLCDLHVFGLDEMDHNVGAITRLKVAEVDRDEIELLIDTNPRITQALWWTELVTMAVQREWTLNVGQRTAYERISHLFCELFLRMRSSGRTNGNSCEFPLTQIDIADATGLTSVHVNRTLQQMRKDGLVELQNKILTIPNLEALKNAGLFNENYLHLNDEGRHLAAND